MTETPFCHLSLREQVHRAQAVAGLAIRQGLEGHTATSPDNDPEAIIATLADCLDWQTIHLDRDDDGVIIENLIAAARALGIAQGLLCVPSYSRPTRAVGNDTQ